jgi:hypothetical protein
MTVVIIVSAIVMMIIGEKEESLFWIRSFITCRPCVHINILGRR